MSRSSDVFSKAVKSECPPYTPVRVMYFNDAAVQKVAGEPLFAFQRRNYSDWPEDIFRTRFMAQPPFMDHVPESQLPLYAGEIEAMGYPEAYDAILELAEQAKKLETGKTLRPNLRIEWVRKDILAPLSPEEDDREARMMEAMIHSAIFGRGSGPRP